MLGPPHRESAPPGTAAASAYGQTWAVGAWTDASLNPHMLIEGHVPSSGGLWSARPLSPPEPGPRSLPRLRKGLCGLL